MVFCQYNKFLHFDMISAAHLLVNSLFLFLKLAISIARTLKDSQNFLIQYLPLYTSCLLSIYFNYYVQLRFLLTNY